MKPVIPKYISSFELEEARLGQAVQKLKLESHEINPNFLKLVLREIKAESVNAEYAIEKVSANNDFSKDQETIAELMNKFL